MLIINECQTKVHKVAEIEEIKRNNRKTVTN